MSFSIAVRICLEAASGSVEDYIANIVAILPAVAQSSRALSVRVPPKQFLGAFETLFQDLLTR